MSLFKKTKVIQINKAEYDVQFFKRFKNIMESKFSAVFGESKTAHAGSQDITIVPFKIGKSRLHLTAETYMGMTLTGPVKTIDEIIKVIEKEI